MPHCASACIGPARSHDAAPLAPTPRRVHLALLTVSILFGANYVFTKQLLANVPASAWVVFRIAAAAVLLVPIAFGLGRGRVPLRSLPALALAALLGVVLNQVLFTEGMALTTPDHSAIINACIPVWTLLLAAAFGQERLSPRKLVAVALALAGVACLLRLDEQITSGTGLSPEQALGDVLTLLNGVAFALHLILMRRVGAGLDPLRTTGVMFAFAILIVPIYGGSAMTMANVSACLEPPTLWYALYGILFATVTTYLLNTWALRHTRSSQVALYINVQPLVAVVVATALGQPLPDWRFGVAFAGVSAGLWLQARAQ